MASNTHIPTYYTYVHAKNYKYLVIIWIFMCAPPTTENHKKTRKTKKENLADFTMLSSTVNICSQDAETYLSEQQQNSSVIEKFKCDPQ